MSDVLINDNSMYDIGDAIREKLGVSDTYTPAEMPAAIRAIETGGRERELTLAEYNALTEEEKMDGTTYYITDADPSSFIQLNDISDVNIISASAGQVLKFQNGQWVNGEESDPTVDRLTNGDIDYIISTIS